MQQHHTAHTDGQVSASQPALQSGQCFLIRRSSGCGCCPDEVTYFGPWREKANAEKYVEGLRTERDGRYKDRSFTIETTSYELGGRWIILNERYAVEGPFIDDPERDSYYYELDGYQMLFRYG